MGKHRKFIDKKHATTYYLSYNPPASEQEADAAGPSAHRDFTHDDDPELAEMLGMESVYEDSGYEMTEERRREVVSLGLPDDGYDYLQHLREVRPRNTPAPGPKGGVHVLDADELDSNLSTAGPSHAPPVVPDQQAVGVGGPSVFIPAPKFKAPGEDAQLVDARALRVAEPAAEDEEADSHLTTVSAFTRTAPAPRSAVTAGGRVSMVAAAAAVGLRGRLVAELAELEESMTRLEDLSSEGEEADEKVASAEGVPGGSAGKGQAMESTLKPHGVAVQGDEEWADWLDEFVVLASTEPGAGSTGVATQPPVRLSAQAGDQTSGRGPASDTGDDDDDGSWLSGEDEGPGALPGLVAGRGKRQAGPGSIASTYWRPEREDRGAVLQNIDEHFENLALQYDDDELGELEEEAQAVQARGTADISMFESVLDEFLEENQQLPQLPQQGELRAYRMSDYSSSDEDDEDEDLDPREWEARRQRQSQAMRGKHASNKMESLDQPDPEVIAATRARLAAAAASQVADGTIADASEAVSVGILEERLQTVVLDRGERWDCESVLSLRSNLDNHPGRIVEPQLRTGGKGGAKITLSQKTGMPVLDRGHAGSGLAGDVIPEGSEGEDADGAQGSGGESGDEGQGVVLERRKGETAEERRARKAAIKEARRASRAAKKELKAMFKGEAAKQKKQAAGRAAVGGGVGMGNSTYVLS